MPHISSLSRLSASVTGTGSLCDRLSRRPDSAKRVAERLRSGGNARRAYGGGGGGGSGPPIYPHAPAYTRRAQAARRRTGRQCWTTRRARRRLIDESTTTYITISWDSYDLKKIKTSWSCIFCIFLFFRGPLFFQFFPVILGSICMFFPSGLETDGESARDVQFMRKRHEQASKTSN